MKRNLNKAILGMLLALALVLGAMAFAENVPAEPPTLDNDATVTEETPAEETPAEEAPAATDDSAALQEAEKALRDARQEARQAKALEALEEELKGYVESGKLTQEQADLILNAYKARQEERANRQDKTADPNFQGKGGRMNGGKGFQGGMNNQPGQYGMNGQGGKGFQGGMNGKSGRGNRGAAPQSAAAPEAAPAIDANDGI